MLLVAALALPTVIGATGAQGAFEVYPTLVTARAAAGRSALGTVNVRLRDEAGRRFRARVRDLRQQSDGSPVFLPRSARSASAWLAVEPGRFSGGPDRVQPIQFRVAVPSAAEPGDHPAAIVVERLPGGAGASTAAAIEAIAIRLTVRVPGALRPGARIVDLEAPGLADGGSVEFATTVRNTGNVTIDFDAGASGGVEVGDEALPPFTGSIYPGETRVYESAWEDPPLFGRFDATSRVSMAGRATEARANLWVLPWREALALALLIVAAILIAFGFRRRRHGL